MKKLFTNDTFFLLMTVLVVVIGLLYGFMTMLSDVQMGIALILICATALMLYDSFRKHHKNVMKGALGAELGMLVMLNIFEIQEFTSLDSLADNICSHLFLFLVFGIFVTHFSINAERRASPSLIFLNQILVLLTLATSVIWNALSLRPYSLDALFWAAMNVLVNLALLSVVICVESRLDAYRLDRESAGWTEEDGYPEGYVHEYEKNTAKETDE